MSPASDQDLLLSIAQGDRSAFAELVKRKTVGLGAYARRLSGNRASAEDLMQETWLKVWSKAWQYQPDRAAVGTWLHRILYNEFIDQSRKHKAELYRVDDVEHTIASAQDHSANPEQAVAKQLQDSRLTSMLAQLPDQQRAAILLFYRQGFSVAQTAEILGIGLQAAGSLLARGRKQLRERQLSTQLQDA